MVKPTKGSCLCGAVSYQVKAFTEAASHCHCNMCRKFHGAAFASYAIARAEDVVWLSGQEKIEAYVSSERAVRGFCRVCGSSLYYCQNDGHLELALGCLDDEPQTLPNRHIHVASKPKWSQWCDDLPRFDEEN